MTYVFKNVIFEPGLARILFLTALKGTDIGLGSYVSLLVCFLVAVREEVHITVAALEGSLSGVGSDVRLQVSDLFELPIAFVIGTDDVSFFFILW